MVTESNDNPLREVSQTSSSLLVRAQLHDQAAWRRLTQLYAPLVYAWCRSWGVQAEDARNVGQEVFVAVARSLVNFQRTEGSFRAWLRAITHNKYVDYLRHRRPEVTGIGGTDACRQLHEIPEEPALTELAPSQEQRLLYQQALRIIQSEFSERDWELFRRVTLHEESAVEVARELGLTANAVYLVKSRILRRLRLEFADLIDIDS